MKNTAQNPLKTEVLVMAIGQVKWLTQPDPLRLGVRLESLSISGQAVFIDFDLVNLKFPLKGKGIR